MRVIKAILIFVLCVPMLISVAVPVMLGVSTTMAGGSGQAIVEVALREYDEYVAADITGGDKYRSWITGGTADGAPWCATFTSWCGNECNLVESGIVPKSGAVLEYLSYYRDNPDKGAVHDGDSYSPVPGDFIVWQRSQDPDAIIESHIGIVEKVGDDGRVYTIEGNSGNTISKNSYASADKASFFIHPNYPSTASGTGRVEDPSSGEIAIDYGGRSNCYTYMGWQMITAPDSAQYKLREAAGMNFDDEGFGIIAGRYVIACTTTFGSVGDYIDFFLADGTVLPCVIGDIKSESDANWTPYGHATGANGLSVIEFVVDKQSWYGSGHANPGTASCHPEWAQQVISATRVGSFDGSGTQDVGGLSSCSSAIVHAQLTR